MARTVWPPEEMNKLLEAAPTTVKCDSAAAARAMRYALLRAKRKLTPVPLVTITVDNEVVKIERFTMPNFTVLEAS